MDGVVPAYMQKHERARSGTCWRRWWHSFRERNYVFHHTSTLMGCWEWLLSLLILHYSIYQPLTLVFDEVKWTGAQSIITVTDVLCIFDIAIRFRTSFRYRGYDVTDPRSIAGSYLRGFFCLDVVSSAPLDDILATCGCVSDDTVSILGLVKLLRLLRVRSLIRKVDRLSFANLFRIFQNIFGLLLFAHWLGLCWYAIAIKPLEHRYDPDDPGFSAIHDGTKWHWLSDEPSVQVRYIYACFTCASGVLDCP